MKHRDPQRRLLINLWITNCQRFPQDWIVLNAALKVGMRSMLSFINLVLALFTALKRFIYITFLSGEWIKQLIMQMRCNTSPRAGHERRSRRWECGACCVAVACITHLHGSHAYCDCVFALITKIILDIEKLFLGNQDLMDE